ncbi:methyltransferase domain-containing protein [Saccharopolyspora erythraea]|uniref:class I SAM-dependent methyltransferase n=1 Tax=Saccharopolyspora erythraea TaxID=1836 RepID=UPI001BA807A4|nr:class I SAM-dependent methyltransferase [Saccharopolyspora erythraea]QUG99666.1 methyltransferase domain-containing protein [Saccharopolyspora erythraea]
MTDVQERLELRDRMYGENDLSKLELFAGGYLNFGYWRDIDARGGLTVEHRVASQEAMYRLVADAVGIRDGDRVLDVGCGRGKGTALVAEEYPVREIYGSDLLEVQVDRAKNANAAAIAAMPGRLHYVAGAASRLPLPERSMHRVFSVEAAQHFEDIPGFAAEAHRVLAPSGVLAVATFFATAAGRGPALADRLDTFASGVDLATGVEEFRGTLAAAGFAGVTSESIGEHVFPGLDRWLARTSYASTWAREWLGCYRDGLVDYYLITATRAG